jgi:hypothetical protein
MVLSLRVGNIPEEGGDYKFGTLVAAARQGMMREAPESATDGQPSSTPRRRQHFEVV